MTDLFEFMRWVRHLAQGRSNDAVPLVGPRSDSAAPCSPPCVLSDDVDQAGRREQRDLGADLICLRAGLARHGLVLEGHHDIVVMASCHQDQIELERLKLEGKRPDLRGFAVVFDEFKEASTPSLIDLSTGRQPSGTSQGKRYTRSRSAHRARPACR